MKKLILEEIVSLKRQNFKDRSYLQKLQQMVDDTPSLKQWRDSGQLMNRNEYALIHHK